MDKLLVVDKNEKIVDLISRLLSTVNYDIYTANTGKTAIAKIKILHPDLIIMDTDLADISGFDVCRTIKSDSQTKYILVLMLISVETKNYILRSVHCGADDYIGKTFDETVLLSKVQSLLRVKHLSDRLNSQYLELKEKNNLIEFQLKMAMQVQRSLIQEIDTCIESIHIITKYLPALEIGGDFYNVKRLDNSHISVIFGDVSGHGISAALLTSMLIMMYTTMYKNYYIPSDLLTEMNSAFCNIFNSSDSEMYACIFYAIIDIEKNTITYSNAGQSFPIYVNKLTNTANELELGGVPIGLINGTVYENNILNFNHGDLLFMHTDGLSDFFYKDNPDLFKQKLKTSLEDSIINYSDSIKEILSILLDQFYYYDEGKNYDKDDVSMILCRL